MFVMEVINGTDSKPRVRGRGRRRLADRNSSLFSEHPDEAFEDAGMLLLNLQHPLRGDGRHLQGILAMQQMQF